MAMFSEFEEVSPYEAEHLINSLQAFMISDVGSSKWLAQHEVLERLNAQAHLQAKAGNDEYVVDLFTTFNKVPLLVYDLILTQLWKENVFPLLKSHICKLSSIRSYVPVYHEATVINLLECLMYHRSAADAAQDALVDVVAYCYKKLCYVCETPNAKLYTGALTIEDAKNASDEGELTKLALDNEFAVCMCVLSVVRFLTDHVGHLPVSVAASMLTTHDLLMLLVAILEKQPWYRMRGEIPQKFENQQWHRIEKEEGPRMPKLQAQVWLAIYNLTMSPECRNRYEMTNFRKDNLLRCRRFLNDHIYDQLPPLMDLHRYLEELAIAGEGYVPGVQRAPPCVIELVPEIRDGLVRKAEEQGGWKNIAERQKTEVFGPDDPEELKRLAKNVYAIPELDPKCSKCGKDAEQRCSRCKEEWYCSRECQVKDWKQHTAMCDIMLENKKVLGEQAGKAVSRTELESKKRLIEDVTGLADKRTGAVRSSAIDAN